MFSIKKTVSYSHIAVDGFISPRCVIDFLQDCGSFHMFSQKYLQDYFNNNDTRLFLAFMQTDIKKYLKYGDEVTINTWIYDMNPLFGLRNYTIFDKSGDCCVCSYAVGVFVNIITGKPAKLPTNIINAHSKNDKFPMEYTPRRVEIPHTQYFSEEQLKVRKYHIDENNHVNNARYIDMACELLSDNLKPKRIRAEYKAPAKYGDIITAKIYNTLDGNVITLCNSDKKPYAVIDIQ